VIRAESGDDEGVAASEPGEQRADAGIDQAAPEVDSLHTGEDDARIAEHGGNRGARVAWTRYAAGFRM
jgi:hypothetical protein